jgi:hypothetical protein
MWKEELVSGYPTAIVAAVSSSPEPVECPVSFKLACAQSPPFLRNFTNTHAASQLFGSGAPEPVERHEFVHVILKLTVVLPLLKAPNV